MIFVRGVRRKVLHRSNRGVQGERREGLARRYRSGFPKDYRSVDEAGRGTLLAFLWRQKKKVKISGTGLLRIGRKCILLFLLFGVRCPESVGSQKNRRSQEQGEKQTTRSQGQKNPQNVVGQEIILCKVLETVDGRKTGKKEYPGIIKREPGENRESAETGTGYPDSLSHSLCQQNCQHNSYQN